MMAQRKIPVYICDRCGFEDQMGDNPDRWWNWSKIYAKQVNGGFAIGTSESHRDLCPDCMKSLGDWWKAGKTK